MGRWEQRVSWHFVWGGAVIHYRLADLAKGARLSGQASSADRQAMAQVSILGVVGHVTSTEKNLSWQRWPYFFYYGGRALGVCAR